MNRGKKWGYFFNEWIAATLAVFLFAAGVAYYTDQRDPSSALLIAAAGVVFCVPAWLRKLWNVKRSTARTTNEGVFSPSTTQTGDVRGLDNVTLGMPAAATTQPIPAATKTYTAPTKKSGFSWGWKIRLVIIGIGILLAVMDENWKAIDRYFPQLNQLLHSGTPTTSSDMDYLSAHMVEDEHKLAEGCPDKMDFKQCRQRILANRPALDDMHARIQALNDAWQKERSERNIPADCQRKMNQLLAAYSRYLSTKDRAFAALQSIDPDSASAMQASGPHLEEIGNEEDAATDDLSRSGDQSR